MCASTPSKVLIIAERSQSPAGVKGSLRILPAKGKAVNLRVCDSEQRSQCSSKLGCQRAWCKLLRLEMCGESRKDRQVFSLLFQLPIVTSSLPRDWAIYPWMHKGPGSCVEGRGQLSGVDSFLLPCSSAGISLAVSAKLWCILQPG